MRKPVKISTMPTNAEKLVARQLEDNTNCEPAASRPRTDLGADMPPVRYSSANSGRNVRLDAPVHTEGQMNGGKRRSTTGKVLTGAAILGGLAAGAYALYKSTQSSGSGSNPTIGNSIAGWLPNGEPITIRKRRTVRAKSSQVYAEWRKLENLPNILTHLNEVKVISEDRSYWCAKGPAGTSVCWYATITEDEPGRAISWQAEENAEVPNSGRIVFSEKPNGDTLIEVRLTYQPPAGDLGRAVAAAFGENPAQQIEDDLTNFKFAMEEKIAESA